jgi:hypothetical protein
MGLFSRYGELDCTANDGATYSYKGWFREGKKCGWGHARSKTTEYSGYFREDVLDGPCTESVCVNGVWSAFKAHYSNGTILSRWPATGRNLVRESVRPPSRGSDASHAQGGEESGKSELETMRDGAAQQEANIAVTQVQVMAVGPGHWYLGQTRDGRMDGLGVESVELEDGRVELYAGGFCAGVRQGHGVLLRALGHMFVGSFENGDPEGLGFDLVSDVFYFGEMKVITCMHSRNGTRIAVRHEMNLNTCPPSGR